MERVVPWKKLCGIIEPFYPKGDKGRHLIGLERMLRIHFLQSWFKNTNFVRILFALANLYMVRRHLLEPTGA